MVPARGPRSSFPISAAFAFLTSLGLTVAPVSAQSNVYVEPSTALVNQTVTVAPGRFASYKLSLMAGTTLVAAFTVEGGLDNKVNVWLLDLTNLQQYQARQRFSFLEGTSGRITTGAKYTVKVPQTDIYYLLVDNQRSAVFPRTVNVYSYAVEPEPTADSAKAQKGMAAFYQRLRQLFVFQDFRISIRYCGFANAFSDSRTGSITLCKELVQKLADQGLKQALTFVLFHELGHTMLNLWGYPMADNEDAADEFATVFMLMLKQQQAALEAAQWWASDAPTKQKQEALSKVWLDDRHTLSPQRARNIIRWLNQRDALLGRWQKMLVPNMQTPVLTSLDKATDSWIDHEFVRSELAKRTASNK